jgi:iron complex transport system ATP-binding protein
MSADALVAATDLAIGVNGRLFCQGLDVAVRRGERWAVVGPNGAGKTTLLRTLAGLARPVRGSIRYGDRPVQTLPARELALRRAVLAQDSIDAFPATVLETVLIGRHPHLSRFAWERDDDIEFAGQALARFGLAPLAQRDVRTLSGGERRRVALAALLVQDTPLALLDEPSSHLDIAQQIGALEVFVGLARERGHAIVMVLHDVHLALRFCDRAIAIGNGSAHAGTVADVLSVRALSSLFGRELVELRDGPLATFVPR